MSESANVDNPESNRSLTAIAEDLVAEWCAGMWAQPEAQHRIYLQPETRQALERLIVTALKEPRNG